MRGTLTHGFGIVAWAGSAWSTTFSCFGYFATALLGHSPKKPVSQATCAPSGLARDSPISGIPHSLWGGLWIAFGSLVTVPEVSSLPCQQLPGFSRFEISARSTFAWLAKKPLFVSVFLVTSLPQSSK
jgi:hypothetical protein